MINLQFQYKFLFQVDLENNYFSDNNLRSYRILPTKETHSLISSFGFLFRNTENGFGILADNINTERLVMQLENIKNAGKSFDFLFYIDDSFFRNYTQITFDAKKSCFLFSNAESSDKQTGNLHAGDFVTESELVNMENEQESESLYELVNKAKGTPLGIIRLQLSEVIIEKILYNLMDNHIIGFNYKIKFDSRESFWKYMIVPTYTKKLKGLKITVKDGGKIKFGTPEHSVLQGNKEALVFQSIAPIKLKEMYDFSFQLKRGDSINSGKTIIKKMQYPSISSVKAIDRNDESKCSSEILVYI